MSNARDKANIPALNFSSTGIDDNATSTAITIDSSENVGIGTASPSCTLHIDTNTADANSPFVNFDNNDGNIGQIRMSSSGDFGFRANTGGTGVMFFQTGGGSERMRIDSSGNVGIGTSSPAEKLEVHGTEASGGVEILLVNEGDGGTSTTPYTSIRSLLNPARNGGEIRFGRDNNYGSASNSDSNIQFYTALDDTNTERMRIDSSGKVLVGTTSTTIDTSNFGHYFDSSGQYKHARDANSTQYVTRVFGNAGNFNIAGDGDATNTNNSYTGISDRTLKENIENANSQWDDIKAIEIKNYNLIEYPNKRHLGVIAQDLEETGMSSLVKTDEDGIKSVKYSILYMKAVKALQEAMTRIETLETKVQTLENNQL